MLAKLPALLQDLVDLWPLILGLAAGVSWARRRQTNWMKEHISDPIAKAREEGAATQHLVAYHLGPNGTTKPLHQRVADIEQAAGIEAPPPGVYPRRWDGS